MKTIPVRLGPRSYPIVLASAYRQLPQWLRRLDLPREGWIVSHRSLLARYGRDVLGPLTRAGWSLKPVVIPESESSKSLHVAGRILATMAQRAMMRAPLLMAFGGGVVGDVTGFVAAVFRRGIPYVQVPTTLLGQVDSAIGGKVAVDLPQGKNLVGAFYQPRLVYNNSQVLSTLPIRQRRSGLAEIIKYGVIADPVLFAMLERSVSACLALEPHAVQLMVARSCAIKARVVSADERETGDTRAALNFGHTLGHALEAATAFRRWTHGEAIAIGMCAASELSVEVGRLARADSLRIRRLIESLGLPTHATGVSREALWRALRYDKKFIRGRPRWVLPTRIGRVIVTEDIPEGLARRVVQRYSS